MISKGVIAFLIFVFVVELFKAMEKYSRLKKFAHFCIVTHCYALLQESIIQ